jgi:uracil-DNA glycosylase
MSVEKVMIDLFGIGWYNAMRTYLQSQDFAKLGHWLMAERKQKTVYPEQKNVFKAFQLTPYEKVKVVFLGLDPYIRKDQATGLSFGVELSENMMKVPPSLKTIIKELESDLDTLCLEFDYSLEGWAKQGVLMLNTSLTVVEGQTNSHLQMWQPFTLEVIDAINDMNQNVIFILLGNTAQSYEKYLDPESTRIIKAPHPAAEAYAGGKAGFYGSKIFSKCNSMLYMLEKEEINWNIQ